MFNKFIADKQKALRGGDKERRPYLATECRDLNAADKWRQEILREIGKKVMEIQNAGLGEHRLRDLNDEINKLIREKGHWERQILKLGGPNYAAQGTMALMRHVASKQHPEALAAPAPHPFYNIGAQENLGDGGGQAWFGGLAPPASDESDNVYQGLERERPRRGRRKPKKHH